MQGNFHHVCKWMQRLCQKSIYTNIDDDDFCYAVSKSTVILLLSVCPFAYMRHIHKQMHALQCEHFIKICSLFSLNNRIASHAIHCLCVAVGNDGNDGIDARFTHLPFPDGHSHISKDFPIPIVEKDIKMTTTKCSFIGTAPPTPLKIRKQMRKFPRRYHSDLIQDDRLGFVCW